MATVGIGDCFEDRSNPSILWRVVGFAGTAGSGIALLVSTDATRFCEVELNALTDGARFEQTTADE